MSHSSATPGWKLPMETCPSGFFISFVCLIFMCTLSGKLGVVSHSSSDFFDLRGAQPFLLPRNLSTLSSRTFIAMMAIAILVVASISGSCFSCNVYTCDLDVAISMLTNERLFTHAQRACQILNANAFFSVENVRPVFTCFTDSMGCLKLFATSPLPHVHHTL